MYNIGEGLEFIFKGFVFFLIVAVILGIYSIYVTFFKDNKTIKTKEHPTVTWELKAKGQKVDTVWVYKFK